MKRCLWRIAWGMSLLIWVGVVALWVRSYWQVESVQVTEFLYAPAQSRQLILTHGRGDLRVTFGVEYHPDRAAGQRERRWAYFASDTALTRVPRSPPTRWGVGYKLIKGGNASQWMTIRLAALSYWIPAGVFGLLPPVQLVAWWRQRRRHTEGQCAVCGYDLRATPERCPECGHVPASSDTVSP